MHRPVRKSRQDFGSCWRAPRGTALELSPPGPRILCSLLSPVSRLEDSYVFPSTSRLQRSAPDKLRPRGSAQSGRQDTVRWAPPVAVIVRDSVSPPEAATVIRRSEKRTLLERSQVPGTRKATAPCFFESLVERLSLRISPSYFSGHMS